MPVSLAQGCPLLGTFSSTSPLQLLSRPSQISVACAQSGEQTPGVEKVHCHLPPTQAVVTPLVHSGVVAPGFTPHTWTGLAGGMPSSTCPLQLSSTPLHASVADL